MKKNVLMSLFAFLMVLSLAVPAFANCEGGHCPLKGHRGGGSQCSEGKGECPIAAKLLMKAHFYLEHQKEIGLKDDQVKAIKAIKVEAKKAKIRQGAEMKIFQMDLESKLSEPQVDVEGLNGMVDEMAAGMTSGAKATIASYAKLKGILTAEQQAKAKELWIQDSK